MKRFMYLLALSVLAVLVAAPSLFAAGDTLTVTPLTPGTNQPGNLNIVINSDTLAGGVRAHPDRVYRLRHGLVYQITEPMKVNGSLYIVANDTTANIRPPVLAPAILLDNSSVGNYFNFIGKGGNVELNNMYMTAQRSDNNWLGWPTGIQIGADSVKLKMRGVVMDGWAGNAIGASYWTKVDIQDCVFRNCMHTSSWFGGQPFMTGAPVCLDTVLFFNNSFVANNSYAFSIRGYTPLARFEHNTMVYSTVNPFLIRQATNIHINNNIFYAQHAMGGNPDHVINGWFLNYPDTASSSMIRIRGNDSTSYWAHLWWDNTNSKPGIFTGTEAYLDETHGVTADMVAQQHRAFQAKNNGWYLPTKLTDFYKAYNDTVATIDSIDVPVYEGAVTKMGKTRILITPTYLSEYAKWTAQTYLPGLTSGIDIDLDPITGDPGFPAVVTNHLDSLINYVYTITTNNIGPNRWAYPSNTLYPVTWPLPENLAYTNASLQTAGTDGLPLGDLNWFPDKKAQWKPTSVRLVDPMPQEYSLMQNYPNPFNPTTTIEFSLPKQSTVSLKVYNALGQEVATLVNGTFQAGLHSVDFKAQNLASGVYFYRLTTGEFSTVKKMMMLK